MCNSSSHPDLSPKEIAELTAMLGGPAGEVCRDYASEDAHALIRAARGMLAAVMIDDNLTPSQLADRLGVHRSWVTRFFNSERDMKVSTLALIARALHKKWELKLVQRSENVSTNMPNWTPDHPATMNQIELDRSEETRPIVVATSVPA